MEEERKISRRDFLRGGVAAGLSLGFLGRREYFLYAYETLSGIESVLDGKGFSVLAFLHGDTPEDQARHLQRCVDRRVDRF